MDYGITVTGLRRRARQIRIAEVRNPPNEDVHGRGLQRPLNVDPRR